MPRWASVACVSVASVGLLAFLLYHAVTYWRSAPTMTWQACMFGDAPCSTAAATWALSLVGIFAFVAAMLGVQYAARMFGLESVPALGQSRCAHFHEDHHPADRTLFVTAGAQLLEDRYPVGVTEANVLDLYEPRHVAIENLSRVPLADVTAWMQLDGNNGLYTGRFLCRVGNLKEAGHERHIVVYISKQFEPFSVTWCEAESRGEPITFHAEDAVRPTVTSALSIEQEIPLAERQLRFFAGEPDDELDDLDGPPDDLAEGEREERSDPG